MDIFLISPKHSIIDVWQGAKYTSIFTNMDLSKFLQTISWQNYVTEKPLS